jgi:hypothetical protein
MMGTFGGHVAAKEFTDVAKEAAIWGVTRMLMFTASIRGRSRGSRATRQTIRNPFKVSK